MVMVGAAAADVTSPAHRAIERRIPILIAFSSLNVGHHPTPAPRSGPDHRSLLAYRAARNGIGARGSGLEPRGRAPSSAARDLREALLARRSVRERPAPGRM